MARLLANRVYVNQHRSKWARSMSALARCRRDGQGSTAPPWPPPQLPAWRRPPLLSGTRCAEVARPSLDPFAFPQVDAHRSPGRDILCSTGKIGWRRTRDRSLDSPRRTSERRGRSGLGASPQGGTTCMQSSRRDGRDHWVGRGVEVSHVLTGDESTDADGGCRGGQPADCSTYGGRPAASVLASGGDGAEHAEGLPRPPSRH